VSCPIVANRREYTVSSPNGLPTLSYCVRAALHEPSRVFRVPTGGMEERGGHHGIRVSRPTSFAKRARVQRRRVSRSDRPEEAGDPALLRPRLAGAGPYADSHLRDRDDENHGRAGVLSTWAAWLDLRSPPRWLTSRRRTAMFDW
jgi:hypothetical protein